MSLHYVAEIREIAGIYLGKPDQRIGPHVARRLGAVRARVDAGIADLQQVRRRIDEFEITHPAELALHGHSDLGSADPRSRAVGP